MEGPFPPPGKDGLISLSPSSSSSGLWRIEWSHFSREETGAVWPSFRSRSFPALFPYLGAGISLSFGAFTVDSSPLSSPSPLPISFPQHIFFYPLDPFVDGEWNWGRARKEREVGERG